ncbi:MAG: hypothetical protein ACLRWP_12065 [Bilophila wadsworthia]
MADESDMVLIGYLAFSILEGFRGGCRCRAEGVRRRGQGADRDNDVVTRSVCGQVGLRSHSRCSVRMWRRWTTRRCARRRSVRTFSPS